MRVVGLDVSRTVAEIAYLEDGQVKSGGRVELVQAVLTRWAATHLRATDHVVLEATGNTTAVINAVRAYVARVVVANPFQVRLIAEARVKTDNGDDWTDGMVSAARRMQEIACAHDVRLALLRVEVNGWSYRARSNVVSGYLIAVTIPPGGRAMPSRPRLDEKSIAPAALSIMW